MDEVLFFSSKKEEKGPTEIVRVVHKTRRSHEIPRNFYTSNISFKDNTLKCQLIYTGCFDSVTLQAMKCSIPSLMKLKNSVNNIYH